MNPPDSEGERLEGWRLTASADALDLVNVDPALQGLFISEKSMQNAP